MARLLEEGLMRILSRLRFDPRAPALGLYKGESRSARLGAGGEFREYREYEPGDDYRHVDWNIYARLDRLVVKRFAEERNRSIDLFIDTSASMAAGRPPKGEYALKLAAAFGFVALCGGDDVRVGTLASEQQWLGPRRRGRERLPGLLRGLGSVEFGGLSELAQGLRESRTASHGELTILISDLLTPGWEEALDALGRRRGAAALIHLLSPDELRPDLSGAHELIDAESGEIVELHVGSDALAAYAQALSGFLEEVRRRTRQRGIAYFQVSTSIPVRDLLTGELRRGGLLR